MSDGGHGTRLEVGSVVRVKDTAKSERRGQEAVVASIEKRKRGIGLKLRFPDGSWGYYETREVERKPRLRGRP